MNKFNGKILALDYGSRRIGIAVSDETNTIAFGREVVENNSECLKKISEIINSDNISEIVLGYPVNLKGGKSAQTFEVEKFEEKLERHISNNLPRKIKIVRWDERFTSKMAQDSMLESGMKKKKRQDKKNLDIISAAILLQSYLDRRSINN